MEEKDYEDINEDLYKWIDKIPLSKRTGNIYRDFSDGGMVFVIQIILSTDIYSNNIKKCNIGGLQLYEKFIKANILNTKTTESVK